MDFKKLKLNCTVETLKREDMCYIFVYIFEKRDDWFSYIKIASTV